MRRLAQLVWLLLAAHDVIAADPFWTARPAAQWTDAELDGLLRDSPWAQTEGVTVYFGTAAPVLAAERERLRRRGEANAEFDHDTDYDEFLRERGSEVIVVTVRAQDQTGLRVNAETAKIESDCQLRSGKKLVRLLALFPPTPGDPFLRLVFPRELDPKADKVQLELYIPAMDGKAWRTFEFRVKAMQVAGKLEI
jgi:hypothetical protein